jgi:hypothetical protein
LYKYSIVVHYLYKGLQQKQTFIGIYADLDG